jgi:hypothetical protein
LPRGIRFAPINHNTITKEGFELKNEVRCIPTDQRDVDMSFQDEKRQHPRTRVTLPVIIETTHGFMDGQILDISVSGAFVLCQNFPNPTNKFFMAIANIPQLSLHIPVGAELIRTNTFGPDGHFTSHGMGVRFTKISAEDRKYISALVSGYIK